MYIYMYVKYFSYVCRLLQFSHAFGLQSAYVSWYIDFISPSRRQCEGRGGAVGGGTALQDGGSLVRFPMVSHE